MTQHLESSALISRYRRALLLGLALIALGATGYYLKAYAQPTAAAPETLKGGKNGFKGRGHGEEAPAVVAVTSVQQGDFPVLLQGLGTVTALRKVTVRSRVDGELLHLAFSEGQTVQAGALLAELDPRPLQIQLQLAQGQLLRDQALLQNAQLDLARYQTLLAQDSIAAQQTKTQEALVKQYAGTVAMDQAQVNNAKLQLSYTHITAPITGRVGLRLLDQGNMLRANDPNGLVVLSQLNPISVVFTLPEDNVQAVMQRWHSGQTLAVTAYDRTGKVKLATGKLTAVDNQIDAATGTLKLKAEFTNTQLNVFANQFVNVQLQLDTLHDSILLPTAAIQNDSLGAYVYVAQANKAQLRRITLGPRDAEKAVVVANLTAHETVVTEGFDGLTDGARIDVAKLDGQAVAKVEAKPAAASTPTTPERRG